jgi:hypothetical protein
MQINQALVSKKLKTPTKPPFTTDHEHWPPNYIDVWAWREKQLLKFEEDPDIVPKVLYCYETRPVDFINHWCTTYDPRNVALGRPARIPLILFPKQAELITFLLACIEAEANALVEKSRDMGATWVCAAFSVWLWLFKRGAAIGWGSRKQELVDRIGDPSSIFEKMRIIIKDLPRVFLPEGFNESDHLHFMRIRNPVNDTTIIGETGDNIGRGGRTLIYFKDEAAYYTRPELIEAALMENTRCQVDISSVNTIGNVFHRKRENGTDWKEGQPLSKVRSNVLVMDWSDHPAKSQEWHEEKKQEATASGLLHLFEREVDRNYSATTGGTIIKQEWVRAAFDAHIKLGIEITGGKVSALDVADGGVDTNAQCGRTGILLDFLDEWNERDTGVTARRAVNNGRVYFGEELGNFQYDGIGVGAGVKAEINRLVEEEQRLFEKTGNPEVLTLENIRFAAWMAGAGVLRPGDRINLKDPKSARNRDTFQNLKAQAWWNASQMFYRTFCAVNDYDADRAESDPEYLEEFWFKYPPDSLISLSSEIPLINKLAKELSQPVMEQSSRMKMLVAKTPDGTKSPNLADCVIMAYWPDLRSLDVRLGVGPTQVAQKKEGLSRVRV